MDQHEDELLVREIGKVGALSGKLGGSLAGVPGLAGSLGGSLGAKAAAHFLPTERYQQELTLSADPPRILAAFLSFVGENGRIASESEAGESPYPRVSGVVKSGFLNMNPAVVHGEIIAMDGESCTLLLTGAAKEGLIKQRAAEKAVKRIVDAMATLS